MHFSFKNTFFALACIAGLFAFLVLGKPLLVPLSTALLLAFILYPVCKRLEKLRLSRIAATSTCLFGLVVVSAAVLFFFSRQIVSISGRFSDFQFKLLSMLSDAFSFAHEKFSLIPDLGAYSIMERSKEWLKESGGGLVTNTFAQTATIIAGIIMVVVFTFLLLIYRRGLLQAAGQFASVQNRKKVTRMIYRMQKVGKQYVIGLAIMITILGIANSFALLLIGLENAFFLGFMAAVLAIIPYVGTALGAAIPALYAVMTQDSLLTPLLVIGTFTAIQIVEGNYLSPRIVGGQLNVNALAAIVALVLGGYVWGIAGMALFLPLAAILKVFCDSFDELKPLSLLLGSELNNDEATSPPDIADTPDQSAENHAEELIAIAPGESN